MKISSTEPTSRPAQEGADLPSAQDSEPSAAKNAAGRTLGGGGIFWIVLLALKAIGIIVA